MTSRREAIDQPHLLIIRILDEHVTKFDLCAVDILASDENRETTATALPFEEGENVAKLSGEESRQHWKRGLRMMSMSVHALSTSESHATDHTSIELVEILHSVEVLKNLRRDGRAQPEDRNLAVF